MSIETYLILIIVIILILAAAGAVFFLYHHIRQAQIDTLHNFASVFTHLSQIAQNAANNAQLATQSAAGTLVPGLATSPAPVTPTTAISPAADTSAK